MYIPDKRVIHPVWEVTLYYARRPISIVTPHVRPQGVLHPPRRGGGGRSPARQAGTHSPVARSSTEHTLKSSLPPFAVLELTESPRVLVRNKKHSSDI